MSTTGLESPMGEERCAQEEVLGESLCCLSFLAYSKGVCMSPSEHHLSSSRVCGKFHPNILLSWSPGPASFLTSTQTAAPAPLM